MKERTAHTLEGIFSLEGHVGIVTGASKGIGRAISQVLAEAGAKVYDFSRSQMVHEGYENIINIGIDVSDHKAMKAAIDDIGKREGLDFLINNAGITKRMKAEEVDEKWWNQIHDINVDAIFFASQYAYPYLKESKHIGRIINIASMASYMGFSQVVPYCSTKSSVLGITRGLAVEWAHDNILVNAISPGWFKTNMNQKVVDQERDQRILGKIPLGKYGETESIGHMVLFLLSKGGTYISGQDFPIDGGASIYGY